MAPGRTQTSALPNSAQNRAPKDTQLYKQLVCKNASYAAKHKGPHQVAMKRNIINNDNNDRGNTLAWDVTVCSCDSGAWERWQRPEATTRTAQKHLAMMGSVSCIKNIFNCLEQYLKD